MQLCCLLFKERERGIYCDYLLLRVPVVRPQPLPRHWPNQALNRSHVVPLYPSSLISDPIRISPCPSLPSSVPESPLTTAIVLRRARPLALSCSNEGDANLADLALLVMKSGKRAARDLSSGSVR